MHTRLRSILAVLVLMTAAPAAFGQPAAPAVPAPTLRGTPTEAYKFLSQDEIARLAFRPGPVNSTVVSDHESHFVEFVKRGDSGNSTEAHLHWFD